MLLRPIGVANGRLEIPQQGSPVLRIIPGGVDFFHLAAEFRKAPGGGRRDGADLGVHWRVSEVGAPGYAEAANIRVFDDGEPVVDAAVVREGIARIRASDAV